MIYIGIDPGKSGGAVAIYEDGTIYPHMFGEWVGDTWDWLAKLAEYDCLCGIEKVRSSPQMGVTSAFTFGRGFGQLEGFLVAAKIASEEVPPQRWQKELNIPKRNSKKGETPARFKLRLLQHAKKLFPKFEAWKLSITKQKAICDALLIAEYTRRTYG